MITELQSNQVFIFGSNAQGFHGAGSAGFAMRGDAANTWRRDSYFLNAMKAPVGSEARVGKWAVFGVSRGLQKGHEGMSYAICTIEKPGQRRSVSLHSIYCQFVKFLQFVKQHPELEFLMTPVGCGYSGYPRQEVAVVWQRALGGNCPCNLLYADCYDNNIHISNT